MEASLGLKMRSPRVGIHAKLVDSGQQFAVRGPDFNEYSYEEVYFTVDQIADIPIFYVMYMLHTVRFLCSSFAFISLTTPTA